MISFVQKLQINWRMSFALWLTIFSGAIAAQDLPFKNYTTADGLAHDRVNKIVRDSRGFLWFCTGEGLSRFDGYGFKNYTQADGLPHRNINDILEYGNNVYLVATSDGLAIFDQTRKKTETTRGSPENDPIFHTVRPNGGLANGRPFVVNALMRTLRGVVFLTTQDALFQLSFEENEWRFEKQETSAWTGRSLEFGTMAEDRSGSIWIGAQNSVWRYDPSKSEAQHVAEGAGSISILSDSSGRIWADSGSSNLGLSVFEVPDDGSPPQIRNRFNKNDGLTDSQWINSIFETSDGRILVGIRNGLCEFDPSDKTKKPAFRKLFATDVVSVNEDTGGNIWLGTATHGAFKLTRRGLVSYDLPEKLPYGGLSSIFPGIGDEIFVTSSSTDLIRFDGEKFTTIHPAGLGSRSWGWNQLDLRSRVSREWWFPTATGLYRYSPVNDFLDLEHTKPKKIYRKGTGLPFDVIFTLFEDSGGYLWFSNIAQAGEVVRFDPNTETSQQISSIEETPSGSSVTVFGEDSGGSVWMGYYSGGVARYRNGQLKFFAVNDGFPSGLVNAIFRDRIGRLWIATSNSGVVRIDQPTDENVRYQRISVVEGLSSNQANCITEDRAGRIYVATAKGINRIDPNSGRIKLYSEADGLPGNSISRCTADQNGNLWFSQKFTMIRLTAESEDSSGPPAIFVDGLHVNGRRLGQISELGETVIDGLSFDSDVQQVQIDYFALSFATGERLEYQFKLNDSDWSSQTSLRTVNLSLQPGEHQFLVRALNSEGLVSETPAAVRFSIARPLWQRWWFLAALAALGALSIYFIYRIRVVHLLRLERVRTRIASDLHDDIGSSLSQIAILSEVARRRFGDEEERGPLDMIAETSREAVDSMSDIVWAINPSKDSLGDIIHRMRRFAGDVLEAKGIEYVFQANGDGRLQLGAGVRRESFLIFKECVNNLAKHSNATKATISVVLEGANFVISVEDNGCGFEHREGDRYLGVEGSGNGLSSIRKRTRALSGSINIVSKTGFGTKIVVMIPIKKEGFMKQIARIFSKKGKLPK